MLRASCVRAGSRRTEPETPAGGAKVVRLVPKMAAIEAAVEASARGDCQPQDVAVAAYLVSNIDRATGECARHYETIAKGCGMSRSAAGRSIKRLVDAGVIERAARFARNRGQIATAFKIGTDIFDDIARRSNRPSRPAGGTPPSHERDTNSPSRHLQYPDGERDQYQFAGKSKKPSHPPDDDGQLKDRLRQIGVEWSERDWGDDKEWLAENGPYASYGYGHEQLAIDDLERWRCEKGDHAIGKAIDFAREKHMYGEVLIDYLEKTWPAKGRKAHAYRHTEGNHEGGAAAKASRGAATQDGGRVGDHGGPARAAG